MEKTIEEKKYSNVSSAIETKYVNEFKVTKQVCWFRNTATQTLKYTLTRNKFNCGQKKKRK